MKRRVEKFTKARGNMRDNFIPFSDKLVYTIHPFLQMLTPFTAAVVSIMLVLRGATWIKFLSLEILFGEIREALSPLLRDLGCCCY
jgi:hypothetical protein